ncbi:MAG TPA: hypothetical protein VF517_14135 [Thermoleophilaceae bacterium]
MVAVLVCGALVAPAGAAPTRVTSATNEVMGLELAGSRLFYGELSGKGLLVTLTDPNNPKRRLYTASTPGSTSDDETGEYSSARSALAASADQLAFAQSTASGSAKYQQGVSSLKVLGGPPIGDLFELESCGHSDPYGPASASVDVDGPRIASTDCSGQIVIRDYTAPAQPTVTRVSPGQGLAAATIAVAGRYVAYNAYGIGPSAPSPTVTVVHDWVANTKLYEVPRQESFDLQADGKLASVKATPNATDCADHEAQWFSAAEPTAHVLPVRPCTTDVHIVGDRVAVVTNPEDSPSSQRLLTLAGTDGSVNYVARLGTRGMAGADHDFDGQRVAYSITNCAGNRDLFTESATAPQPRDEEQACPVLIRASTAGLGPSERTIPIVIECSRGCNALAIVRMRLGGKLVIVGSKRIRLTPDDPCTGGAQRYRLKLASPARREVRRRGSVKADLIVSTPDRAGVDRTTKRKLTLRAAKHNASATGSDCSS